MAEITADTRNPTRSEPETTVLVPQPSPHDLGLEERLGRVRLLALDVDGTLTAGAIVLGPEGEIVVFDVHDGQGLVWLRRAGVRIAWITGRGSAALSRRAAALSIDVLREHVDEKARALADVQRELGIAVEETASMGDDLPDLGLAARSAVFFAPANAREEVRARADLCTAAAGGRGAVREVCERLLRARGSWQQIVDAALGR